VQPVVTDRVVWSVCLLICYSRESRENSWTDRDAVWVVELGGPKEACVKWGAHWRHLVNTIEPYMCSSNAAFCQIISTTCCYYYYRDSVASTIKENPCSHPPQRSFPLLVIGCCQLLLCLQQSALEHTSTLPVFRVHQKMYLFQWLQSACTVWCLSFWSL